MRTKLCLPQKHLLGFAIALAAILSLSARLEADATIGVNVPGLSQSGSILEPDVSGAAGPDSYAEFVNGAFGVFDKTTGAISAQSTDHTFWENAGISSSTLTSGARNPRLIYDPNSSRWFAIEITNNSPTNNVLLAVSTGANPSPAPGNWNAISFSAGSSADPYGSFPTLGVDANGVYIATDDYQSSSQNAASDLSGSLFSIPKSSLLASTPSLANMTTFQGSQDNYQNQGYILQPVIDLSPRKGNAVVIADNYEQIGVINQFTISGTKVGNATLSGTQSVTLAPYAYPPSPRQPDGSGNFNNLNPGLVIPDDRYASSAYQVGNLVYTVHTVGLPADGAAAKCCALQWSVLQVGDGSTTVLVEQGMISKWGYDLFNPSICANASGDVVIGYNRSGTSQADGMIESLVSVGTTSAGNISFQNAIQLSSTTVTSFHNSADGSPWGDYSSMSTDPSNSSVFWFAQEVPASSNDWGTQFTEIDVPEPSAGFAVAIATILSSARSWRGKFGKKLAATCS